MKAKMYSAESNTRLHKTIDEFHVSHNGIKNLKSSGTLKNDQEYVELIERNIDFFIKKIREFRLAEKMVAIAFAFMFAYFQISGEDLEMRRARRVRTRSRRRNETECPYDTLH